MWCLMAENKISLSSTSELLLSKSSFFLDILIETSCFFLSVQFSMLVDFFASCHDLLPAHNVLNVLMLFIVYIRLSS